MRALVMRTAPWKVGQLLLGREPEAGSFVHDMF